MAKNPNEKLKSKHVLYCSASGGGKTTAIHNLGKIPKNEPVVLWDPYKTFNKVGRRKVEQHTEFEHFYRRLAYLHGRSRGQPFAISLVGKSGKEAFELFGKMVWSVADGNKILHVVFEELLRVVTSTAKADGILGELYQGGRKFGLICHALFQRGQEVPKTVLRGSPYKWVGKVDDVDDAKYWAPKLDKPPQEIAALVDLHYFLKSPGANNVTKGILRPL